MRRSAAVVAVLALVTGVSFAASADTPSDRLARARTAREQAVATVDALEATLGTLQAQRAELERSLDIAAADLLDAYRRELEASTRLTLAEERLDERARAAYQIGPGASLALFFTADSPADLLAAEEFAASTLVADAHAVEEVQAAQRAVETERAAIERHRATLRTQGEQLAAVLDQIEPARLADAREAARQAGLEVTRLEAEQRALDEARARAAARQGVDLDPSNGVDQSALLALLGPDGGRTCDVPEGLHATGQTISGMASWYGWDFAGQPTASGAVFDPRLFTVAHRTLPLGTFLRVHYGERCAVVLVNDRGPYGSRERIIDLSLGVAQYLGSETAGVVPVTADVLVPGS